jgi:DNA-binding response OmpR family regulator
VNARIDKILEKTKRFNVLFVEDDIHFRAETEEIFVRFFYRVDVADDGEQALRCYEKNSGLYGIVITDINMPKINGVELIKSIYTINPFQNIIVISAHNSPEYLIDLVNLGIEQFILKPFDLEKFLETLEKISKKMLPDCTSEDFLFFKTGHKWCERNKTLYKDDLIVPLTKNEIILMQLFIKNGHKVTTTDELQNNLFDDTNNNTIENLKPIISRFRKKTEQEVENIYGFGYRLII